MDPDRGVTQQGPEQDRQDGGDEDAGHQRAGDPVGQPLGGAAAGLLGLHHVHDAGQGVVLRGGGDRHLQGAGAVDRPGEDVLAGPGLHRHGLAGDRRGVQAAAAGPHPPVGRQPLPGPDHHDVPDHQLPRVDHELAAGAQYGRLLGHQVEQRPQAVPGPGQGVLLQALAEGEQERQRGGLLHLPEQGGADGADRHQQADAELAARQPPQRTRDEGGPAHQQRCRGQYQLGGLPPREPGEEPTTQQGTGEQTQLHLAHLPEPGDRFFDLTATGGRRRGDLAPARVHEDLPLRGLLAAHAPASCPVWVRSWSGAGLPSVPTP